ncbi:carbon catabolite repressor protein 4 homolog 5-like, partial [Humulus lupulus]|uniref:carbon catabolite repressor protein 4 homolog 5-like n=1 Tax=Humulus lupulus TaxID=3486 RepID=UPI002B40E4B3
RGDIKLGQVRLLLEKASKLSCEWGCIPVILCGDLNSIPQSPIYQFLASSKLDIRLYDRRKISGQIETNSNCRAFRPPNEKTSRCSLQTSLSRSLHVWSEEELKLATGCEVTAHLEHRLNLCSAYLGACGSCRTRDNYGEPLATSYHSKFMGTVDYIWHTEELVPVRVLETLPIDILKRTGGLPSKKWGSDHLALVCELAFAD